MPDNDNRIDFTEYPVDLSRLGLTGQAHDQYPQPNTAARFDLMRQFLIGLLSNQSCNEDDHGEPSEKRTGTLWFKKKAALLTLFNDGFKNLSEFIGVVDLEDQVRVLQDVITELLTSNLYVAPRIIWPGFFTSDEVNNIPIPEEYQGFVGINKIGVLVYVDGRLIDPRKTVIVKNDPAYIHISSSVEIEPEQSYTVIMEHITSIKTEDTPAEG